MMRHNLFANKFSEEVEIRRNGEVVFKGKALVHRNKSTKVSFEPGTDLREGDVVVSLVSGEEYVIESVEKMTAGGELFSVNGHYSPKHARRPSHVVNNSGILAQNITGSAIQQHSPNATQIVHMVREAQRERVKDAIHVILGVLNELDIPNEEKEEIKGDAEFAAKKLESPKSKLSVVKDLLWGICGKVQAGLTEKVAGAVVSRVGDAVQAIKDFVNSAGA